MPAVLYFKVQSYKKIFKYANFFEEKVKIMANMTKYLQISNIFCNFVGNLTMTETFKVRHYELLSVQ